MNHTTTHSSRPGRRTSKLQRRMTWTGLLTILSLLVSLFPQVVGQSVPAASAHNLQTRMVYMFFDPATQACLDARIASISGGLPPAPFPSPIPGCAPLPGGWVSGNPIFQNDDEVGVIIKVVPRDGTTTGVGGHIDFYVPDGVEVTDVAYVVPDGSGGYTRTAMKGQSPIAIGAGPIGAKTTAQLVGLSATYSSAASGISSTAVDPVTGLHRGTISGVYGDTGIFYATDPDLAYGSWQRYTELNGGAPTDWNDANPKANRCGSLAIAALQGVTVNGQTLTNNSGDVVVPCNKWDAGQLYAWGVKGTSFTGAGASSAPIVDYGDGRGNAPWGFAAGTGGPQSGYAWNFNWNEWAASAKDAAAMRNAMGTDEIGPWKRIQYDGDRVSYDQPGLISTVLGYASKDAGNQGVPVSALPLTSSQTDATSPKAIRWAVGQLTAFRPEYAWVKVRVDNAAGISDPVTGCPDLRSDTFGGDAGGTDNGKDHLWRYYEPTEFKMNLCVVPGKPAGDQFVKSGDLLQYPIKVYNLQTTALTNVVVKDTLGAGLTFQSAVPAQNSGPNPLVWNVGTLQPGQKFQALLTVKATATGYIDNCMTVYSDQLPPQTSCDTTISGSYPYLVPTKTARSGSISPGDPVIYDVLVRNIGEGPTGSPVTIREYLPAGFAYDPTYPPEAKANGASVTPTVAYLTNPNEPVFTIPAAIQGNNQLTLTFRATTSLTIDPGSYCNSYSVTQNGVPITTGSAACVTVGAGAIGDFVWRDWNGNGMQDAGEEGIPDVIVKLYVDDGDGVFEPGTGDTLSQTDKTDPNGIYGFTGLGGGSYWVAIDSGVPADHTLTGDPQGALDGHALVVLPLNGATSDIDFGYQPAGTAVINGNAYEDSNDTAANNFEPGDIRIDDVTVNLYEDTDGDGILGAGDLLIATDVTDANGLYEFTGLASGLSYLVDIVQTDPDLAGHFAPDAYAAVPGTDGFDPRSVLNLSGTSTQDFGYDRLVPSSIGDEVFIDLDGSGTFTAGDTPLANVTVTLYQDTNGNGVVDGSEAATAVTTASDATGKYLFDGLVPGDYIVVVDSTDADIPPGLSAQVDQYAIDLPAGIAYPTADFPFEPLIDKTVDPATATAGQTLTYTILPKYPGPELLVNAKVTDPIPAGTTYDDDPGANAGGEFVDTSDPADGPDSIVWSLGSNSPALAGVTPPSLKVFCPATLTVNPEADTFIDEENKNAAGDASGSTTTFKTSFENNKRKHALLRFSLSTLPAGASIESAMLQTTLSADYGSNKQTVQVRNLLTGFAETTATWNDPNGGTAGDGDWATSGGAFGASDYGATVYASAVVPTKKATVSFTVTDLAKSWQTGPNNGMVLLATGTSENKDANWFSRSGATKPTLVIKYLYESGVACSGDADAPAVADTYINEEKKDEKKGTLATLLTRNQTNKDRNTLVRFDLSAIPSGATINSVTLQMYVQAAKDGHTDSVFEMTTGGWTETGATWNKKNGAAWASGAFSASDYNGTALGSLDPSSPGLKTLSNAALKTLVEAWVAGTKVNSGVVLITTGTGSKADEDVAYTSREGATTANRPKLIVNWTLTPALSTETRTELHINDRLHSGTTAAEVEVTMVVSAKAAVTGVSPGSLAIDPGAATVSCGSASPAGLVDLAADVPVTFKYVCSVTPGASPSSVKFGAKPTSSGSVTFNAATSEGLRTSPPLTYQVTVNNPAPSQIVNTATLTDEGAGLDVSDEAITAVGPSIGDLVWADLDGDGNGPDSTSNADPGEPGIANVTVWLDDGDGVFEWTDANDDGAWDSGEGEQWTTTDATGRYHLYGLTAGTPYNVRYVIPAGYVPSTPLVVNKTLAANEQYTGADFGLRPPGTSSIGDTLWIDANEDGVVDAGETPIANVDVRLYADMNNDGQIDPGDLLLQTVTTDALGNYLFTGVAGGATTAGNYLVDVLESDPDFPAGLELVSGGAPITAPPPNGRHDVTINAEATSYLTADFGYNWAGTIGDFVWWDYNPNKTYDPGAPANEVGIANAIVLLYVDANNNGVLDPANGDYQYGGPAFTGACPGPDCGIYHFDNLPPGKYLVDVYEDSITTDGVRDIVPTTEDVVAVDLAAGATVDTADFGYFVGARVEGNVFHDDNRNGSLEAPGENGLQNIGVTLTGTDMFGNPISQTTTTDASGHFVFLVPEGNYTLTYNTAQTTDQGYPDATTATSISFHAQPGDDWQSMFDFGVDYSGQVGDLVWNDANNSGGSAPNGGELGIPGVTVNLYASDGATWLAATVTDADGKYLFPGLANGTYVVKVDPDTLPTGFTQTYDNSIPAALDHTGQGVVGGGGADLTVDFSYYNNASYSVSGAVWDDNGDGGGTAGNGVQDGGELGIPGVTVCLYDSTGTVVVACTVTDANGGYTFPGISNGDYVIKVDTTTLPSTAYYQTGDPDGAKDNKTAITVNNANVAGKNFGYDQLLGSITGTLCEGTGDGLCDDAGDTLLGAGVPVFLTYAGPDGIIGTADDVVTTTATDSNGDYQFTDLPPGSYQVSKANPAGMTSLADADGGNPNSISVVLDFGPDGIAGTADDRMVKIDQDFEVKPAAGAIGDRVWLDTDGDGVQDIGEPGLPNVVVELKDGAGAPIDSDPNTAGVQPTLQTTDMNGNYLFINVPAGNYQVDVDQTTLPAGLAASPGTTDPKPVTLAAGQSYLDADFGYTALPASAVIGDYVWADANADGIQDPGEAGIGGVTVELRGPGPDGILGTLDDVTVGLPITTDPDGSYLFTGVVPGQYLVQVSGAPLTGYTPTTGPQSEGATTSTPVTVAAGDVVTDVDFGFSNPAALHSISDRVWYDSDRNGVLDPGESGIGGVTVNLLDNSGNVIATVTSNPDGTFTFPGVPDGNYTIQISDNTGQLTDLQATTPSANAGQRPVVVSGADVTGVNFGYAGFGPIGDTVFSDHNGDGVQDPGEPGIAGVEVKLYFNDGDGVFEPGTDDTLIGTRTTDGSGTYLFNDLPQGTFWVSVDDTKAPLTGYTATTTDQDGTTATSTEYKVTLTPSAPSFLDADFGYQQTSLADVKGTVWNDTNADAVQGGTEPGIPGVTVTLVDASGNVVATTTTNASGNYTFFDVPPGNYTVVVTDTANVLDGYTLTSGLDVIPVTVAATDITDVDFGYVRNPATGAIGDTVWHDANRDGVQNGAEGGLPNVVVELKDGAGQAIDSDPVTPGVQPTQQTTDMYGRYLFNNLPAGNYTVDVVSGVPSGMAPTAGTTDPSAVINLSAGELYPDADFGYASATGAALGDFVWHDVNGDGIQDPGEPGIGVVAIQITPPAGVDIGAGAGNPVTVWTDPDGSWLKTGLPPGNYTVAVTPPGGYNATPTNGAASRTIVMPATGDDVLYADFGFKTGPTGALGDTIYRDANGNGSQDGSEPGIAGVTFSLLNSGGTVIATTVTDANGVYAFPGLPNGAYTVVVTDINNVLAGLRQTQDPDQAGVCTTCNDQGTRTISGGATDNTVDFGYAPIGGTIGNQVWHDKDGDGLYEPKGADGIAGTPDDESGMQGVLIDLYLDTNNNGLFNAGIDNLVRTTTTDINGQYEFTGLPAGKYLVDVAASNAAAGGVLEGFSKTTGAAGANDNSQADPYPVTLTSTGGVVSSNITADFGYDAPTPYSISGTVFNDLNSNGKDDGEPPLPGATVYLIRDLNGNGVVDPGEPVIGTMLSNASGDYLFTDLPNGKYVVTNDALDTQVNGYFQTTQLAAATRPAEPVTINGADEPDHDFGYFSPLLDSPLTGAIGDRVWLDENGDGVQDAGEAGIANVKVTVSKGAESYTTYTDANGGYVFSGLGAGTWTVTVDPDHATTPTLPNGLYANPTYDENGTVTPHTTTVALAAGEEHLTADFGYNWVPPADSSNPGQTATGAIGDRVWADADGDGVQDPGEPGLGGVTVSLLVDSNGDGIYGGAGDSAAVTTTTAADGSYIFDSLPPGSYVIKVTLPGGYTQTGDPDGVKDNATTTPVVLAPGDVYVNADFGYQLTSGANTIGDLIYLDSNGDGTYDAGEPGIAGVTVALLNGSGAVIATTTTDASGAYSFPGLPDGTYTVWVNDTANVLGTLAQSSTPDNAVNGGQPCGTCNGRNTVTVSGGTGSAFQDFGFTPAGQTTTTGLIGDTIFLDTGNGAGGGPNGAPDPGEGLEGVTVELYDSTGTTLVATTTTDENGHYYFGGLTPTATYVVKVDATTLPNGGAGLTNTIDPDAGTANQATVNLGTSGPINLAQDFGYTAAAPGAVTGTLWNDSNADGALAGEAGRYGGVTVALLDSNGDVVATTTTKPDGSYSFPNLPAGSYTVDVTDDGNVLNGTWHSLGTADTPGQSQTDPKPVTVTAGVTTVVDFGYYRDPAGLGNFVWDDLNKDGIQDSGEPGIDGVLVTLTVTYPNGATTTVKTVTGDDPSTPAPEKGWYSFGNLLLDENFNASTAGDPTTTGLPKYITSVATPSDFVPTLLNTGNGANDSDDPAGTVAVVVQGQLDNAFDFGFQSTTTSVTLSGLQATTLAPWEAVLELLRQLVQPAAR